MTLAITKVRETYCYWSLVMNASMKIKLALIAGLCHTPVVLPPPLSGNNSQSLLIIIYGRLRQMIALACGEAAYVWQTATLRSARLFIHILFIHKNKTFMRKTKLLSIVAMLLFTTGAWAAKTVTWNSSFISSLSLAGWDNESASFDGITVTASGDDAQIDHGTMNISDGGSFTFISSIGDITAIRINAENLNAYNANSGWSVNEEDWDNSYVSWSGDPSATVTLSSDDNINISEISSIVFTINAIDYTATPFMGVYDGQAHGISVSAESGATVKYGTSADNCTLNASPTFTEVGTHVVYFKLSASGYSDYIGSSVVDIWPVGTVLSETFDYCGSSLPTGWTTETVGWENDSWGIGAGDRSDRVSAYSGSQNVLFSGYNSTGTGKLTTPEFAISSSYNACKLSFWYVNNRYAGDIDELRIYYRTESGGELTQIEAITAAHGSWTKASYLLPANVCQVVFQWVGHKGYSVGIDDIVIKGVNAYSIAYDLAGGSVATANPTIFDAESSDITLTNPTKTGYDFLGWTGSNGTEPQTTVTIATGSEGDRTYTANWQATEYTITYNLDGGTASNPATYTIESSDITLTAPTKTGFTFMGWTGTDIDGTATSVTIATGSTGNREYTAVWQANAVILADGAEYTRTADEVVGGATYTKTLGEESIGKFQAWLVPFDYTLTADDLEKFTFYKINMIANSPDPATEATDEMWVFVKKLAAGDKLYGNMPYVYKPLVAVTDYEFTTDGATLKAKNTGVLMKTETAEDVYSFYASYANTTATTDAPFYYVANDGTVCYGDAVTLGSMRWFIRKTNKYGETPSYARQMHFFDGESSETTGINSVDGSGVTVQDSDAWYTLDGRRIAGKPAKSGIYVNGGRKVIIK